MLEKQSFSPQVNIGCINVAVVLVFLRDAYKDIDVAWQLLNNNRDISNRIPRKKFEKAVTKRDIIIKHLKQLPPFEILRKINELNTELETQFQRGLISEGEKKIFSKRLLYILSDANFAWITLEYLEKSLSISQQPLRKTNSSHWTVSSINFS